MIKIPPPWNDIDSLNEPSFHANKKFCEEDLARSGLTTSDMPVFSEPFAVLTSQFASGVPLVKPNSSTNFHYYTIPYYNIDGTPIQDKTGRSKMYRKRTTDKEHRYISPQRSLVGDLVTMPYFNPLRLEKQCDKDLYVIVEGEKKYSKLLKEVSLYGCAIGGKDMWQEDGKVHPMLLEDILAYAPKEVRIVPDGDWRRQDIFASYSMLIFKLRERLGDEIRITVADLSGHLTVDGDRVGIDDYLHAGKDWGGVDVVDPEHGLLLSANVLMERYALEYKLVGRLPHQTRVIRNHASNAEKLFSHHPLFNEQTLRYNADIEQPEFQGNYENVISRLQIYCQRYCHMPDITIGAVRSAAEVVLSTRHYSPFAVWLRQQEWDGKSRVAEYASLGLKTSREPEPYRAEAVKRLILQMVARSFSPGCKTDTVIVFVGKQGAHKTTHWEVFSKGSFAELPGDINDKDAMMVLHSKRVIIVEEMNYYRGKAIATFKALVTRVEDTYRAPYSPNVITRSRRCMIVGNTNDEEFMREIENRRLMPIYVEDIDIRWLTENINQLYAEGVVMYDRGDKWWSEDEGVWEDAKNGFMVEIPNRVELEYAIERCMKERYVEWKGRRYIEVSGVEFFMNGKMRPNEIGPALRRLGWEDEKPRRPGFKGQPKIWRKP